MTNEEIKKAKADDLYCCNRIQPSDVEIRLFLREVDYHCPICGKDLQPRNQKKKIDYLK